MTTMPITSIEPSAAIDVQALAIEIANDASVVLIESYAERSHLVSDRAIWDVSAVDALEVNDDESIDMVLADLQRAVKYLDMRGRIERPVVGQPNLVAIRSQA